jgi:hypothetical protein
MSSHEHFPPARQPVPRATGYQTPIVKPFAKYLGVMIGVTLMMGLVIAVVSYSESRYGTVVPAAAGQEVVR